jgi:hypothetical protein
MNCTTKFYFILEMESSKKRKVGSGVATSQNWKEKINNVPW